jgi:hypothetical protein
MRAASFIALALLWCGLSATRAGACVYSLTEERFGPRPTAEELAAEARQRTIDTVRARTREAELAWRKGVNGAAELAEMLVPNVRPIEILRVDCLGSDEIDYASDRGRREDWLAGTAYAGQEGDYARILREFGGSAFGRSCNAEMRWRFAEHLRRQLTPQELRGAYIFLGARRPRDGGLRRLTSFDGGSRHPPLHWIGADPPQNVQIARWLRSSPAGQAVKRATDAFWAEAGPLLGDNDRICPASTARHRAEHADLLRQLDAEAERRRQSRRR